MTLRGLTGWVGCVLGTPDPRGLADFYARLLGGEVTEHDETWVTLMYDAPRRGYLAFQLEVDHREPRWPAAVDDQQMQMHLDIGVRSLGDAVEDAVAAGATQASYQPQADVRVMLDPAGHPFCLYLDGDAP